MSVEKAAAGFILVKHFVIITINTLFNRTHIINCKYYFLIARRFFETYKMPFAKCNFFFLKKNFPILVALAAISHITSTTLAA